MKVSGLGHFPLGAPVPDKEHAVCVSLPTFDDVIGYEEKESKTLRNLNSGYPRFVKHSRIKELSNFWARTHTLENRDLFFFPNKQDWDFAQKILDISNAIIETEENYLIVGVLSDSSESERLEKFFQHAGCGLSSRHAEIILQSLGQLSQNESIISNPNAEDEIKRVISKAHGPDIQENDVLLASSGANAFSSTFRSSLEISRKKKKEIWIRIGWLYLDTIKVMDLLTLENEQIIDLHTPDEFKKTEKIFSDHGNNIAGVVTEFPSNPLFHSCDLEKVRDLCTRYDAILIADPTMASPKNARVSKFADVVINSLTKYANWEGDVMMGSAVFPQKSSLGLEIKQLTSQFITKPFHRDIERTAEQIPFYNNFIERTNASQQEMVEFLLSHPKIKSVHWAYQESTGKNYQKIAGDNKPGCVLSFEIKGDFRNFYDNLELLKSPSFGTEFSLCCPYVYLAHYDLIKSNAGKEKLRKAGLSPELLRLSVGLENPSLIKEKIALALKSC